MDARKDIVDRPTHAHTHTPTIITITLAAHARGRGLTSGKNHFYEMKEDVGMSHHVKKKVNKKMHTPRHKVIHNHIPT